MSNPDITFRISQAYHSYRIKNINEGKFTLNTVGIGKVAFVLQVPIHSFLFLLESQEASMATKTCGKMRMCFLIQVKDKAETWNLPEVTWQFGIT
jgi:hypothetical protein